MIGCQSLRLWALVFLGAWFGLVAAESEDEIRPWQENEVRLPSAPRSEALLPFYVSASTENRFFVDASSLTVGDDGVLRFVLVVLGAEGARNVTFEGMRCEAKERRLYASGRTDGSWSKSRNNDWMRIRDAVANRHYATLYLDYFCPGGVIVRNAQEAVDALRRGGHPAAKNW